MERSKPLGRTVELQANAPLRPMSDKKRARLAAQGITNPYSTITSTKRAAKPSANTDPDDATVVVVLDRDGKSCVVCLGVLHGIRGIHWSIHHRKLRSQGGDNCPGNLASVCGNGTLGCHGRIHANPKWAQDNGYIVKRDENPLTKQIVHALHGHVFLTAGGGWTGRRPEVAA